MEQEVFINDILATAVLDALIECGVAGTPALADAITDKVIGALDENQMHILTFAPFGSD